jgi:hypothetical protein
MKKNMKIALSLGLAALVIPSLALADWGNHRNGPILQFHYGQGQGHGLGDIYQKNSHWSGDSYGPNSQGQTHRYNQNGNTHRANQGYVDNGNYHRANQRYDDKGNYHGSNQSGRHNGNGPWQTYDTDVTDDQTVTDKAVL